jgi:hypothetical protein
MTVTPADEIGHGASLSRLARLRQLTPTLPVDGQSSGADSHLARHLPAELIRRVAQFASRAASE